MRDPIVYDKAEYHYGGDYPEDLTGEQAFVHTGMYLGWIIDHDLYSEEFASECPDLIKQFKAGQITGARVYEWWDGCLSDDMLNEEGNAFSQFYFDFEQGQFLADYDELLAGDLPSLYHVEDSQENYDKLKARINQRYEAWKKR
jgi:hypothetical protein